ncbi:MAG: hypothetical protein KGI46_05530 [Alphaproteobacteria bacterium]|nr:hypothetical protein [Alphaproteobacteria bacterium]
MMNQRRVFSGLMAAALVANTIAPAYAESGADSYPSLSLPTTPAPADTRVNLKPPGYVSYTEDELTLPELFIMGVIALGGGAGHGVVLHYGEPPRGEYDPVGAARDRGEQPPPPPPPPATPTTAMATTPEGQAGQQQLAKWKADLEKKIADPKTSPQEKQIAENKLTALNQYGAMQQADAGAAGAPGGR